MIRTLVVDDDFRVAAIHAAYVERVPGFEVVGQVHSAGSLAHSVALLKPDLVLLDLYLPDHHGLEVLKWLRQPSSGAGDVDVIVITAASDTESIRTAMQGGAVHYLLKPFGFPALQEKLLGYAELRDQLRARRAVDQATVDRLYRNPSAAPAGAGAGPHASQTLEAVEDLLARHGDERSAAEVAAELGVSRATAQRYLAQLRDAGRVTMTLRYGTAGRPEHRYRARPDGPAAG